MAPLARGADEMGGEGEGEGEEGERPAGWPARCPIALGDGGPGLNKAAQIARAEGSGSAKGATRQARARATGNQNNRRPKRDGRTRGTAWNSGVPESSPAG